MVYWGASFIFENNTSLSESILIVNIVCNYMNLDLTILYLKNEFYFKNNVASLYGIGIFVIEGLQWPIANTLTAIRISGNKVFENNEGASKNLPFLLN